MLSNPFTAVRAVALEALSRTIIGSLAKQLAQPPGGGSGAVDAAAATDAVDSDVEDLQNMLLVCGLWAVGKSDR